MNINSNSVAPQKWLQQLEMWCSHKLKLMEFPLSSPYCFNFAKWPSYFNNLDHYYLGKNIYFKTEDPTQLRDPLQISYGKVWVGKQSVTWLMFIYREHLSRVVTISYTTRIGVQIRYALRILSKMPPSSCRENFPDREFSLPKHQNFGYAPLEIKRRFEWKSNKKVIHKIDFCIPTSAAVVVKNDYSSVKGSIITVLGPCYEPRSMCTSRLVCRRRHRCYSACCTGKTAWLRWQSLGSRHVSPTTLLCIKTWGKQISWMMLKILIRTDTRGVKIK